MPSRADTLRRQIVDLVADYHDAAFPPKAFEPGVSSVPCAGRVFDAADMQSLMHAGLDFWLTEGRFVDQFEEMIAAFFGLKYASVVNSGSSANLVAFSALTSPALRDRQLKPGDEVITAGVGFPTTVNPIIQQGLTPVFIDVHVPTYNMDVSQLEAALSSRTRAVMAAHTLGNPFDLGPVSEFCKKHNLWLIEDCCDALGSTYDGQLVGTFGDFATLSFYPAHHITMGEGGCVLCNRMLLKRLAESFRDWGRDCWCDPGKDNTCGIRFEWQLGNLPYGYDHKYTYSHVGYNLKATDLQAAVGVSQMDKLPYFIEKRRQNYQALRSGMADLEAFFILPEATPKSDPSWFGFPLSVRPEAPFDRRQAVQFLESRKIGTRQIFAGNLIRQKAYQHVQHRTVGKLPQSDFVMNQSFWIGVYPGLSQEMIDYVLTSLHECCRSGCHV